MSPLTAGTLLRCPRCRADLEDDPAGLRCSAAHVFAVREGVPDLVAASDEGETWAVWREHLEAFQRRREQRVGKPETLTSRLATRSGLQGSFRAFVNLAGSTVLDVGCGPGRFREQLGDQVRYVGVDPIPLLPDVLDFEFARAVSEMLPFADGSFSDVVVLNALDHMNDVEASLIEIRRILVPGGRLHILQTVLDRGDLLRRLAHEVKDFLEDRSDAHRGDETPHHMTEFTSTSLRAVVGSALPIVREAHLATSAIAPRRMMLTAQKGLREIDAAR